MLILGGSQGSLFINQTIYQLVEQLAQTKCDLNLQIIHQTGDHEATNFTEFYLKHKIPAIVFNYDNNLMPYYKLADLIICRSGAGTLAEILPLKTSCITIPLQTSYTNHQLENALELAKENSWVHVLKQAEITRNLNLFIDLVDRLLWH
jgi:UDP-N-acetylglucosamine--N-acetylmuramyl-(pentapeptide) pyrophosphoryl-undecaprenol N-acetylglucosamine transferase